MMSTPPSSLKPKLSENPGEDRVTLDASTPFGPTASSLGDG